MNMHNTETQAPPALDAAIAASNRLVIAMAAKAAANTITGILPPGPDFDAAEAVQHRTSKDLRAALEAYANNAPTTPLALANHLRALVTALEHEHDRVAPAVIFPAWDEPDPPEEPTLLSIARMLADAYESIFESDGGIYRAHPPAAQLAAE